DDDAAGDMAEAGPAPRADHDRIDGSLTMRQTTSSSTTHGRLTFRPRRHNLLRAERDSQRTLATFVHTLRQDLVRQMMCSAFVMCCCACMCARSLESGRHGGALPVNTG